MARGGTGAAEDAVVDGTQVAELEMLTWALEMLTRALVGITLQSLEVLGDEVSLPQFRLLLAASELGRAPSSRLAEATGVPASSVTRLADRLEAAGLLARGGDVRSRSIVTAEITSAGRDLVARVVARRHELFADVLARMAPGERPRPPGRWRGSRRWPRARARLATAALTRQLSAVGKDRGLAASPDEPAGFWAREAGTARGPSGDGRTGGTGGHVSGVRGPELTGATSRAPAPRRPPASRPGRTTPTTRATRTTGAGRRQRAAGGPRSPPPGPSAAPRPRTRPRSGPAGRRRR